MHALFKSIEDAHNLAPGLLPTFLRELQAAMIEHCSCEEQFIQRIGYPNLAGHQWHHAVLLADLQKLIDGLPSFSDDSVQQLRAMIVDHQRETDADYVAHYDARREA